MSDSKHTPGKWKAVSDTYEMWSVISVSQASIIAVIHRGDGDEANARRIVAAVNAVEGIPVEALEQGVIKDLLDACLDVFDTNAFYGHDPDVCTSGCFSCQTRKNLVSALARVKGIGALCVRPTADELERLRALLSKTTPKGGDDASV